LQDDHFVVVLAECAVPDENVAGAEIKKWGPATRSPPLALSNSISTTFTTITIFINQCFPVCTMEGMRDHSIVGWPVGSSTYHNATNQTPTSQQLTFSGKHLVVPRASHR
jgi:hypothetical protein